MRKRGGMQWRERGGMLVGGERRDASGGREEGC